MKFMGYTAMLIGALYLIGKLFGGGDYDRSSRTRPSPDVENAYRLGEIAVQTGLAVEYDISGWNQFVDLSISSLLPERPERLPPPYAPARATA